MADFMEVEIGHDMLERAFSDGARKHFFDALDLIVSEAAEEAVKRFDEWWEHIRFSCYISSISEHDNDEDLHGRLSMWRALLGAVTCIKHKGFQEELEWRAIYTPKITQSPLMECSTEVIGGVPQLIYKIPLDKSVSPDLTGLDLANIFDRLIIGPSPFPVAMYEAFVDALAKAGVSDASGRVWNSNIPLRI
jgi:hypothetical protein